MTYSRDELATFSLQKLASIYPQTAEEDVLLQEMFEKRASVSNYFTLTSLVDVKHKWQEDILQKYIDEKRETMAPENPVSLTVEDESKLDSNQVTKEIELELQAKLDKHNKKRKPAVVESEEVTEEELDAAIDSLSEDKGSEENPMSRDEAVELMGEDKVKEIEETAEVLEESPTPKKKRAPKKK